MSGVFARAALVALLFGATVAAVDAQDYPTKPIRFIVPWPPGGGADIVSRIVGQRVGELFGQQDRLGQLALADIAFDRREQPLVERLEEVPRLQVVADPLEGGVVVEERAQKRLLGLHVGRGVRDRHLTGDRAQVEGWYEGHGLIE